MCQKLSTVIEPEGSIMPNTTYELIDSRAYLTLTFLLLEQRGFMQDLGPRRLEMASAKF